MFYYSEFLDLTVLMFSTEKKFKILYNTTSISFNK